MKSEKHRFIRLNYANGDMVGHTGVFHSAVLAVESVDLALSRLMRAVEANNGMAIITADHGNSEEMFETDEKGNPKSGENNKPKPKTSHTLNPVPFIIFDPNYKEEYRLAGIENPGLSNIASTCLQLLGYKPPAYYDPSLIEFK
jgi:2,3-bisphosphoglycerate-independent phosphoglycerate mutase